MNNLDLKIKLGHLDLKNPVITASGTFGFGREYGELYDINQLGAITTKGITLKPKSGNPPPRIAETYGGILNSVGLENPGIDRFIEEELPFLECLKIPVIVNIAGNTIEDYAIVAERLRGSNISAVEINISCPNVNKGGLHFGTHPDSVYQVTKAVRDKWDKTLIIKLTPNVTSITEIALAAQEAGADVISLINTLLAMDIDIHKRKAILGNILGGLSGPAVLPVALRMVYQIAKVVKIPIIGMGGIMTGEDAIKFLLAGASAISIGTGNFIHPTCPLEVLKGIEKYMKKYGFYSMKEIIGQLQ
ncbi:dihydroorotate dehydrogenase [Garciella nitratireducens]|uniref:dihydroorotate dehydrogenase n=1 Tax=Garciella nitratireducens TaxID=218205 RepID=UPI001BD3F9C3|nr:dihydroorotate dehydrogenase [Garciella nitratireducens]